MQDSFAMGPVHAPFLDRPPHSQRPQRRHYWQWHRRRSGGERADVVDAGRLESHYAL